ncbi:MAG: HNH endonuclease [Desertifilum sp.]|nr:HNH endonuclease [Desertifilum sp.]
MSQFNQNIADLLSAIEDTNRALKALKVDAARIKKKYDPVTEAKRLYNNWRDSDEGQKVKEKLYNKQEGLCADINCLLRNQVLPIQHLEIDHILPISKRPDLALKIKNLQLLCHPCNNTKNNRV